MKRKNAFVSAAAGILAAVLLAGCGSSGAASASSASASASASSSAVSVSSASQAEPGASSEEPVAASSASSETAESVSASSETVAASSAAAASDAASGTLTVGDGTMKIGSLKGPTTMGLVNLMQETEDGEAQGSYSFTMETQPDAVAAEIVSGAVDAALIPANMASIVYNKTQGGVTAVAVNTLGVLYCVTGDESISSVKDLAGKTVYSTGQGATPEYALNYLLEKNGVTDCTVEFRSEATEIAALLAQDPTAIAILPQPFVTVAEAKNDALRTAFSLADEWDAVSDDRSKFLTGVTVVRNDFLKDNKDAVDLFLQESADSVQKAQDDVSGTAALVVKYGIIEKEPVAEKALPSCGLACITGSEMKEALSGYLNVLYSASAESVGGALPGDDFYYGA